MTAKCVILCANKQVYMDGIVPGSNNLWCNCLMFECRTNAPATTSSAGGLGAKTPGFGNFTFGNPTAGATSTGFTLPQPTTANLPQKTVRFELPTTASSASPLTSLLASTTAASAPGQLWNVFNYELGDFVFVVLCMFMHILLAYSVSQKNPPSEIFWHFFPNGWEFLVQILHTYCTYVHTFARVQIFIQLPATLTKLRHIKHIHHYMLKMSAIDRNARWAVALNMA